MAGVLLTRDAASDDSDTDSVSANTAPRTTGKTRDCAYGTLGAKLKIATARSSAGNQRLDMSMVCFYILAVELCERLAFYTFTGTQEFFLERSAGYSLAQAAGLNAAMTTLCMVWALVAGWFADVVFGRYRTILAFGVLYFFGSLIATVASWPGALNVKLYLVGMMLFVPLGTAGIKANISNFGADQYDESVPSQRLEQEKFFNWFYMSINIGSGVAYGYLTTLAASGGLGIPKEYGYFAVYAMATFSMLLALIFFVRGRASYRMQPVQRRSALGEVARYVLAEVSTSREALAVCVGSVFLAVSIGLSVTETLMGSPGTLTLAAFVLACLGVLGIVIPCLDPSWVAPTVEQAAQGVAMVRSETPAVSVRSFLRLLPALLFGHIGFGALYNSMQYWYQQQACQMDLHVFSTADYQFAGSFFMIADCLGILVATPIALSFVNPTLERVSGGRFGHSAKYSLGMLFAGVSVVWAAHLEVLRRDRPLMDALSNCAPKGIRMSQMSASWMIVPYFFMGVGEIYTQPVLMHFAYIHSPPSMRTLAVVFSFLIGAVANSIFAMQISALKHYVPNDLNGGQLEYGYYMNICLAVACYTLFAIAMRFFERPLGGARTL